MFALFASYAVLILNIQECVALPWSYDSGTSSTCDGTEYNKCGPENWGQLYPNCAESTPQQSPINLAHARSDKILPLPDFFFKGDGCDSWEQGAESSHLGVDFSSAGCYNLTLNYGGESFYLANLHFHSPSEHTIGGGFYSAEAHLLHYSFTTDRILYIAILLQEHAADLPMTNNSLLDKIWNAGGQQMDSIVRLTEVVKNKVTLNPYVNFFPGNLGFYAYNGNKNCAIIV